MNSKTETFTISHYNNQTHSLTCQITVTWNINEIPALLKTIRRTASKNNRYIVTSNGR